MANAGTDSKSLAACGEGKHVLRVVIRTYTANERMVDVLVSLALSSDV